jgi:hypothetical protein
MRGVAILGAQERLLPGLQNRRQVDGPLANRGSDIRPLRNCLRAEAILRAARACLERGTGRLMDVRRLPAAALPGAAVVLRSYGNRHDRGSTDAQQRQEEQESGGQAVHSGFLEDRARETSAQARIDSCQGSPPESPNWREFENPSGRRFVESHLCAQNAQRWGTRQLRNLKPKPNSSTKDTR